MPLYPNFGLTQYKKGTHRQINAYLRRIGSSSITDVRTNSEEVDYELMVRKINDIDREMYARGGGDAFKVLYRGCGYMNFGVASRNPNDLVPLQGQTLTWWAYTSTTFTEHIAQRFARGGSKGIFIIINTLASTKLNDLTRYKDLPCTRNENEVLLERGTRFRIDDVDTTSSAEYAKVTVTLLEKQ